MQFNSSIISVILTLMSTLENALCTIRIINCACQLVIQKATCNEMLKIFYIRPLNSENMYNGWLVDGQRKCEIKVSQEAL